MAEPTLKFETKNRGQSISYFLCTSTQNRRKIDQKEIKKKTTKKITKK
jgi:hypothetical protein